MKVLFTSVAALAVSAMASASLAQTTVRILTAENDPALDEFWGGVIAAFEAENPDVSVVRDYMSGNDIMARMPTIIASDAAPDIIYSWGGGVMRAMAETGQLRNLRTAMEADGGEWMSRLAPSALDNFTDANGDIWGVPYTMALVPLIVNLTLLEQAGVDPDSLATWEGFLSGIETLKDAGITPIALGARDKWPVHFYWTYLALREGGAEAFQDAKAREGLGFEHPAFVAAGERLIELSELQPFQRGFEAAGWTDSTADFAAGRAAMILGFSWLPGQIAKADDSEISGEDIMQLPFPLIGGGAGIETETFGGLNGFILLRNASDEALEFMRFATNLENQSNFAAINSPLPIVPGASDAITDPGLQWAAGMIENSTFNQIFLDQDLGPEVGWGVVNEQSFELVTQNADPAEVAAMVQEAWLAEAD